MVYDSTILTRYVPVVLVWYCINLIKAFSIRSKWQARKTRLQCNTLLCSLCTKIIQEEEPPACIASLHPRKCRQPNRSQPIDQNKHIRSATNYYQFPFSWCVINRIVNNRMSIAIPVHFILSLFVFHIFLTKSYIVATTTPSSTSSCESSTDTDNTCTMSSEDQPEQGLKWVHIVRIQKDMLYVYAWVQKWLCNIYPWIWIWHEISGTRFKVT